MDAILENVVRSPKFPRYVDELNELREKERVVREQFRETAIDGNRAEFINGEVITYMPARHSHSMAIRNIGRLASVFAEQRGLGIIITEQALIALTRNDYVPDVCFWLDQKSKGIDGSTTIYPVPDFIVEVLSPTTAANDREVKFEDYAAHGVSEYWIVDADKAIIEQYVARDGKFELVGAFSDGVIRSSVIEGFEMPVIAAFDEKLNLDTLKALLASNQAP